MIIYFLNLAQVPTFYFMSFSIKTSSFLSSASLSAFDGWGARRWLGGVVFQHCIFEHTSRVTWLRRARNRFQILVFIESSWSTWSWRFQPPWSRTSNPVFICIGLKKIFETSVKLSRHLVAIMRFRSFLMVCFLDVMWQLMYRSDKNKTICRWEKPSHKRFCCFFVIREKYTAYLPGTTGPEHWSEHHTLCKKKYTSLTQKSR